MNSVMFAKIRANPAIVRFRGSGFEVINRHIAHEDIRSIPYNITKYPGFQDFMREACASVVPIQRKFLDTFIVEGKKK